MTDQTNEERALRCVECAGGMTERVVVDRCQACGETYETATPQMLAPLLAAAEARGAEREREACASECAFVAERHWSAAEDDCGGDHALAATAADACRVRIRARGEVKP